MSTLKALVIDDEPDIRELLTLTLLRMGIEADCAKDVRNAKAKLDQSQYNICLTDMMLPDGNGLDVVKYIQSTQPSLPVAVITAHGNMDTAVEAMKSGAFDFLNKPVDLSSLRQLVDAAISSNALEENTTQEGSSILGDSERITALRKQIAKLARSQAPVYISGESGTGKELAARAIHQLGPRASKPFIAVNCGAIPAELVESEFFGYKKGAFTGAHQDNEGLFQAANGGTLFLDEVADLPLSMQVKILRAIQEKAVRKVGSQTEIKLDVRILSATHKNLHDLVAANEFRQDLFYRLNVIQLDVPPLRDRKEDIPILTQNILARLTQDSGETISISQAALNALCELPFPGNVRELENTIERAYTMCDGSSINENDISLDRFNDSSRNQGHSSQKTDHFSKSLTYDSIDEYLAEIEKDILLKALEKDRWNKTNAAKTLGISFRSFRYRLSKLGLGDD